MFHIIYTLVPYLAFCLIRPLELALLQIVLGIGDICVLVA